MTSYIRSWQIIIKNISNDTSSPKNDITMSNNDIKTSINDMIHNALINNNKIGENDTLLKNDINLSKN